MSKTNKSQEASSKMSSKSMKADLPEVAAAMSMSKEEDSPAQDKIIEEETNTVEEVAGTEEEASDDKSSFASWVFETLGDYLLNGLGR